tara:strand:- start:8691 stop:9785 length:1095 start_codon:yes stop_codon:yes gene_type:complete
MKISVISPILNIAGVPLAQVRLARSLAKKKYKVDLIFGQIQDTEIISDLNDVNIINFKKKNIRSIFFKLCQYLINAKPDIIFTAEDHLNILVSICSIITRSKVKISASSRVTPFDTYSNKLFTKRWFLKYLFKATSWRINLLTCVSKDMVKQYQKVFGKTRHICIYNIVEDENSKKKMNEKIYEKWFFKNNDECKFIIAAGKLAPWKGFDYLLKACKVINDKKVNFKLSILGDGPEKNKLIELSEKLGINSKINFLGYVKNPLKYFKNSDVFVLSSLVEGMPNVLIEAMMCGCTIVSTDCDTGPKEISEYGNFGHLVKTKNYIDLANGIMQAFENPINNEKNFDIVKLFNEKEVIKKHFEGLKL